MANVLFKRLEDSSLLDNIPVVDGSFYITKNGKTFIDYDDDRIPVAGTPDTQMSDTSTNTVQNNIIKQYVDNVGDRVSVFEYDLTTDGDAVKTGRQIDGKDEYVKRFHFTGINSVSTFSKNLGFTLSDVMITQTYGTAYSNSYNWFPIPMGDFLGGNNYAVRYSLIATNNVLQLNTANTNFTDAYINIYYINRN